LQVAVDIIEAECINFLSDTEISAF